MKKNSQNPSSAFADYYLLADNLNLTPEETLDAMFAHTAADGTLYVPGWCRNTHDMFGNAGLRCRMNWCESDVCRIKDEYAALVSAINGLSKKLGDDDELTEEKRAFLTEEELRVWETYIRPFDFGEFDVVRVEDIDERMSTADLVREIGERRSAGEKVSEEDADFCEKYKDESVSAEDKAYWQSCLDAYRADVVSRVGKSPVFVDLMEHSCRLCRLWVVEAPAILIRCTAVSLAEILALHRFAEHVEVLPEERGISETEGE